MNCYQADLHIHSVLSPCADLLMTPGNIIKRALETGLDLIAITDHNSARNVEVAMEMASNTPLTILPGMEVTSKEEVHLLCLFDKVKNSLEWQRIVEESLPEQKNDEDYLGYQIITDVNDRYQAKEERLLATATKLTVKNIVKIISSMEGIVIPAHIDRPYYSLLSNLGFISAELDFFLFEISANCRVDKFLTSKNFLQEKALIKNSDSHYLESIRPMFQLCVEELTVEELRLAALDRAGRKIKLKK